MNLKKVRQGLNDQDLNNLNLILDEVADTFPYQLRESKYIGKDEQNTRLGDWIKSKIHEILGT
jgi:hypothetical protein